MSICQVYPHWDGGGTVKISFLNSDYDKPSSLLIQTVQNAVDPYYNDNQYKGKGLGKAPIGHVVTVVAPTEVPCNISAKIEVENGFTVQQVEPRIIENLQKYLLQLRKKWSVSTDLNEYALKVLISGIHNAIFNTQGVVNVDLETLTLNGATTDLTLIQTSTTQQIPILGSVTITEV